MGQDSSIVSQLRKEASTMGFDAFGVTRTADSGRSAEHLQAFLAEGRHGDMTWMANTAQRRAHPNGLWAEARSAIMVGMSYAPSENPLGILEHRDRAAISVYAHGKDYHELLKAKLKQLAGRVAELTRAEVKVFVDTAPLMEKPLAAKAGLGWQGKHTNLVSREHGSWLFLGAILTTAELPPDAPEIDHCGSCQRCLDICPTHAFPAPYQLDARRCVAYLTIEHKGHIAREFRKPMGNRVFGCDDCLAVCPWNKFAEASHEAKFSAGADVANPPLHDLLALDDTAFRMRFSGTPVKRTGRDRIVRNALIAAGNSGDCTHAQRARALLVDASPLVRAMAVWALWQLDDREIVTAERSRRLADEPDAGVREEWLTEDRA